MAHFIPTKKSAMAQKMWRLFFSHMFKHHGIPKDIVSNWNPKSTSKCRIETQSPQASVELRPKVHKQVLANLVEVHGVEAQDEHFIPTLNIWTN
jgi:hypothetical protein